MIAGAIAPHHCDQDLETAEPLTAYSRTRTWELQELEDWSMSSDLLPEISAFLPALFPAMASRPGRRLDFPPQLDREFFPTRLERPRPVQRGCKQQW